jgi:hypothetical protein
MFLGKSTLAEHRIKNPLRERKTFTDMREAGSTARTVARLLNLIIVAFIALQSCFGPLIQG